METKDLKPTKGYEKMPLQIIVHLQSIEIDEFYAEDSDDGKSESGKPLGWIKRDIDKTLALADPNPDIQIKLYNVCSLGFSMAHPEDASYKPLADAMRAIGFTIIQDKEEQKQIIKGRRHQR